jgi:hypothetical protein
MIAEKVTCGVSAAAPWPASLFLLPPQKRWRGGGVEGAGKVTWRLKTGVPWPDFSNGLPPLKRGGGDGAGVGR